MPDSMYEAQIQAKNKFGWSPVSEKFQFFTKKYGEYTSFVAGYDRIQ